MQAVTLGWLNFVRIALIVWYIHITIASMQNA